MNKIIKILPITLIIFGLLFSPVTVSGISVITSVEALIDTSITREDDNYSTPREIIIAPIFANEEVSKLTSEQRYRGIYSYTVEYLGFSDIPYHYLVDKTGTVYQGNQGGAERKVKIEGIGDELILIGYMTDRTSNRFNYRAEENLINIITQVANANSIKPEFISVENVIFQKDEESKTVSISKSDLFGNWNSSMEEIKAAVSKNFAPLPKSYSVNVNNVTTAATNIQPGEEIEMTVDITNNSTNGIYGGSSSEFLISKVSEGESRFFLNNVWQSITQVSAMEDGDVLKSGASGQFSFKIKVPLFIGNVSEEFIIENIDGASVSSNKFFISLDIQSSDKPIVEILNTETGQLNVRTEPSSVAPVLSKVSPEQRFFKTDDAGNGWIKIQLNNGEEGWIAGWYTKAVN